MFGFIVNNIMDHNNIENIHVINNTFYVLDSRKIGIIKKKKYSKGLL